MKFESLELKQGQPEKLRSHIEKLLSNEIPEKFIDKGAAGEVYLLDNEQFCMKVMIDRHNSPNKNMYDLGNTVSDEASFLRRMENTNYVGSTRTPEYWGVLLDTKPEAKNVIVMEKLYANNLQHLINSRKMPENFDHDSFFSDLEKFIQNMHQNSHIIHNDLYARNIMVDIQSGHPRIIDFGRAIDTSIITNPKKLNELEEKEWKILEEIEEVVSSLQKKRNKL